MLNKYELIGLLIKTTWVLFVCITMIWAVVYGIEVFIGGVQTYIDRRKQ